MRKITFNLNYENYLPTDQDIIDIENLVEAKLPKDYLEHMLEFNSIDNEEGLCVYPIKFESQQTDCIDMFSENGKGIVAGWNEIRKDEKIRETSNLKRNIKYYCDKKWPQIPQGLFPIGAGGSGDALLMGISGAHYGKIYYWVREYEESEEIDEPYTYPGFSNIGFVANSFTEFLEVLYK